MITNVQLRQSLSRFRCSNHRKSLPIEQKEQNTWHHTFEKERSKRCWIKCLISILVLPKKIQVILLTHTFCYCITFKNSFVKITLIFQDIYRCFDIINFDAQRLIIHKPNLLMKFWNVFVVSILNIKKYYFKFKTLVTSSFWNFPKCCFFIWSNFIMDKFCDDSIQSQNINKTDRSSIHRFLSKALQRYSKHSYKDWIHSCEFVVHQYLNISTCLLYQVTASEK